MKRPTPDRRRFNFVWRLGRVAVALSLFGILLSHVDLSASLAALASARLELLMLLLLAVVLDRVLISYRWYILLRHRSPKVTYEGVLRLVLVSGFVGYFIPGGIGVELVRIYGLARTTSDPLLSVSSVLVERVFALIALIVLILLGLAFRPPGLPPAITYLAWAGLVLIMGGVVVLMAPNASRSTIALVGARPALADPEAPSEAVRRP